MIHGQKTMHVVSVVSPRLGEYTDAWLCNGKSMRFSLLLCASCNACGTVCNYGHLSVPVAEIAVSTGL